MTKDQTIDALWENAGHGTRREDVVAAYEAGVAAERERCAKLCDGIHERHLAEYGNFLDHTYAKECAAAIRAKDTP